ncbi:alpha/beta fold hydrolase [Pseudalkalibacillus sp. NRS-1564]|uniref:alpha/beta fold hydrolase n=1 Tax=Pseudalkalibacillus sp. NRS-1564 TaxID=3233900 RepID=UPI003D2C00F7
MWKQTLINTKRGTFEVFIKGNGPPLCVTHLYSQFNESGDYFADTFTTSHKVYLVNLKDAGHSDSVNAPYEYFMLETVFDLESVRSALGVKQWTFAGHSTGGMLGCVYGIHASRSLTAIIIVGAAAREYGSSSSACIYNSAHENYHIMQHYIEKLKDSRLGDDERERITRDRTKLSLYLPEKYQDYFSKRINKKMATNRMNFFAREIIQFDVTKQLNIISAPTLIACGKHDVQCPLLFSEEIADGIPNAQLAIFDQSNHYPFLEEKALFETKVHDFLNDASFRY